MEEELAHNRRQSPPSDAGYSHLKDFDDFFTTALDLFCIANTEGHFIRVNKEWENILGYSTAELENSRFLDFVHPDDIPATLEALSSLDKQKVILNFTNRYRCKDGSYHYIEWRSVPRGKLIYAAARDITERLSTQEALRLSEMRFELAMMAVNDAVWDWDIANNKVYFDNRYYTMAGYEPNEFPHSFDEWTKRVHPEDLEDTMKEIQNHIEGKTKGFDVEFRFRRKDGNWMWLRGRGKNIETDPQGHVLRMIGTHTDITDRKKAEVALKLNEERLQSIFRVAPIGIGVVKNRVFTELNPRISEMTGYTRDELIGQSARILYPTEEDFQFVGSEKYRQINQSGTGSVETRWLRKDGTLIDIILASTPINVGNLSEGVTFTALDITYRKRTEEALQLKNQEYEALNEELTQTNEQLYLAKEKAEESDRLKTAFLQNMSHEIRTPMNAIVGFSDFLRDEAITEEKRQAFVQIIIDSSHQLLNIINDILTISFIETKLERVNIQPVALNLLINELISIFQSKARDRQLELKAFLPFATPYDNLLTDRTKLVQILTNLLSNAVKFTSTGYIETGYRLMKAENNKFIEIYVKDTGIGIAPEKQQLIFERFVQGDNSIRKKYGGTGLGLSICEGFARLLQGSIHVVSQPGSGSEFILTLPYHPASIREEPEKPDYPTNRFATLLVAEDDEYNLMYLKEYFSGSDLRVIYATDGLEAVDFFRQHTEIDLVLMDIKMPGIDGYEAARQIKALRPAIPVIAQSAYALSQEIERYADIFDSYITKPIDRNKLSEVIAQYIHA